MAWIDEAVSEAVETAFRAREFAYVESYLYFKRGRLAIATEPFAGMALATAERVPRNKDRSQLKAWVLERVRSVPCLPE